MTQRERLAHELERAAKWLRLARATAAEGGSETLDIWREIRELSLRVEDLEQTARGR